MSKYSRGPWKVRKIAGGDCFVEGAEEIGTVVGRPYHREIMGDEVYPEKEADAALVAAAPDLLAALEGAAMVFRMWDALPKIAREPAMRKAEQYALAAIAKANGES